MTAAVDAVSPADAALIESHTRHLRRCDARPDTIHHRRSNLRRLAAALPCGLLEVDDETLWGWQDDLRERVATASLRCYTSHARMFYRWAREQGLADRDLAADLRTPRVPVGRARPIDEDTLRLAIKCARDRLKVWLILAAFCGLRAGEIARLTATSIGDDVLDVDGKGGKVRTIPLPADVRAALIPYVRGSGPLFVTPSGAAVRPEYVSAQCCEHLRKVGAPSGISLHKLRHRYATRLYELSLDALLVQNLLGHSSLATTQVYLGVSTARARSVVNQLAETLDGPRRDDDPPAAGVLVPT